MSPPALAALLLASMLLPVHGHASGTALAQVAERLATTPAISRGQFEQSKKLAELETNLRSTGDFVLLVQQGLLWEVETPFASTLVIRSDGIRQLVDGQETLRIGADEQPGTQIVTAVLLAVFEGDVEKLDQQFLIDDSTIADEEWRIVLRPRSEATRVLVEKLILSGGERVQRVRIHEGGGDQSDVQLTYEQPPSPLSKRERALLAGE